MSFNSIIRYCSFTLYTYSQNGGRIGHSCSVRTLSHLGFATDALLVIVTALCAFGFAVYVVFTVSRVVWWAVGGVYFLFNLYAGT